LALRGNHTTGEFYYWTWLGPDGFLGPHGGQGLGERVLQFPFPTALIMMGDWCGPREGDTTAMTENRDAEQNVTLLQQEEKPQEHKKVFAARCNLLTRAF
jgi:hypothetical protein